ncbi:MFS transporter [Marinimicrobium alkaliphilum]|uniref:MFS transporter n=1 Tax=Marinimicrobium alkaliphilum TaxID=2202654 RepID=UPI000DB9FA2E|nr:MFS transporter [Marinimicrobium alkaliphilum]
MTQAEKNAAPSQFALLRERRFLPFFIAQFGGAFNDNFYKSALLILFTYGGIERWGLDVNVINNLVAATLIIPFFLFAPLMGQYADKYEKALIIRRIKVAEILTMVFAAIALWLNSPGLLMLVLFLTGTQSACFSPLKYSILPQHVSARELTGANGLVHTGTSLAIFLGLIAGTLALEFSGGRWVVAAGALLVAWIGWRASCRIPDAPPADAGVQLQHNIFTQTLRTLRYAREYPMVFWSIMGASWYWFLGSVYLTQLPNFTRSVLYGSPAVVSVLLILFLLGICVGALLCERLSRRTVEPAIVPLGALLVALFGLDLAWSGAAFERAHALADGELYAISDLFGLAYWWRIVVDVTVLGVAGGLYMIPLAALMQSRSRDDNRAQIIAANNVINAIFMVLASVVGVVGLGVIGLSIPQLFVVIVVMHLAMMTLLFVAVAEFRQRFFARFFGVLSTKR